MLLNNLIYIVNNASLFTIKTIFNDIDNKLFLLSQKELNLLYLAISKRCFEITQNTNIQTQLATADLIKQMPNIFVASLPTM